MKLSLASRRIILSSKDNIYLSSAVTNSSWQRFHRTDPTPEIPFEDDNEIATAQSILNMGCWLVIAIMAFAIVSVYMGK
jgi:hypothetical protein